MAFFSLQDDLAGGSRKGWVRYQNDQGDFEILYPEYFSFSLGADGVYSVGEFFPKPGEAIATVAFPRNSFPETNFSHAFLTVALSDEVVTAGECQLMRRPGEIEGKFFDETKEVNGVTFHVGQFDGAAAGTLAETRVYHTLHKGKCFGVSLNLFTFNIDNFELGEVREVKNQVVWKKLEDIFATFRFLP